MTSPTAITESRPGVVAADRVIWRAADTGLASTLRAPDPGGASGGAVVVTTVSTAVELTVRCSPLRPLSPGSYRPVIADCVPHELSAAGRRLATNGRGVTSRSVTTTRCAFAPYKPRTRTGSTAHLARPL